MIPGPVRPLLYDKAVPRLMPYVDLLPDLSLTHPTVVGHTNGGPSKMLQPLEGSLYDWFARPGNTICSHFQIMLDGTIEQYVPLNKEAYAQYSGNAFAWSVEHEDDGDNTRPLTDAQLAAFSTLVTDLGVPWVQAPDTGGGVGWHSLYADWNQSGHDCPGPVRAAQFAALIAQGGFDMPLSDADVKRVVDAVAKLMAAQSTLIITHTRNAILADVELIKAEVAEIKTKVGA